jgi:hypothetical protein
MDGDGRLAAMHDRQLAQTPAGANNEIRIATADAGAF